MRVVWLACLVAGVVLIGSFAYGMWSGYREQQRLNQQWQHEIATLQPAPQTEVAAQPQARLGIDPAVQHPVDGIDFAIRIPKLSYFSAVKEGISAGVLYSSPGHYPSTVWPGSPGTVGVAAHNVYWINFPQLSKGDEIDVETRYGLFRYRVTGSEVVNPDDRSVLVPDAAGYHLTLTTCWPLWAGAFAKQRFVIFTRQFSPVPIQRSIKPTSADGS
ncbi:MAG TPA: class D sortase [Candidatus Dormibacteraeota bacterium]|nr:class D sortase [Candidatus Dormibacteraeota bacterium]